MALFSHGLLPASFRGVPFGVLASEVQSGRRIAPHLYPGRDEPWMEDMGRAPRAFRMRGFIVADDVLYLGGPIQLQRALLTAAAEKEGSGLLTHPTLGVLQVVCRSFAMSEDLGAGTTSEISFEFVESGKKSFPSLLTSGSGILSAAALGDVAIALDVVRVVALVAKAGGRQADAADVTTSATDAIAAAATDATALQRLTAQLPGNNGRFAGGGNSGAFGTTASPYANDVTVADLVADASRQRSAVTAAIDDVSAAVVDVLANPAAFAGAVTTLTGTLLAACADPADALRLMARLTAFAPLTVAASTAIGAAVATAFRRSAAIALARACAAYQPLSYDDAFALLVRATEILDALATEAADAGDDASYDAIRALRIEVVQDLRARGATLARVRLVAIGGSLPALTIAQRLYRDPARADQLVNEAAPRHPLFMPAQFQALAA